MEEDKIIGKLHFSFTNTCEATTVDRIFNEEPESYETIWWFLEEFKYFLKAMGFADHSTDRIIFLEDGEKVIDKNGEVLVEA